MAGSDDFLSTFTIDKSRAAPSLSKSESAVASPSYKDTISRFPSHTLSYQDFGKSRARCFGSDGAGNTRMGRQCREGFTGYLYVHTYQWMSLSFWF